MFIRFNYSDYVNYLTTESDRQNPLKRCFIVLILWINEYENAGFYDLYGFIPLI